MVNDDTVLSRGQCYRRGHAEERRAVRNVTLAQLKIMARHDVIEVHHGHVVVSAKRDADGFVAWSEFWYPATP